MEKDRSSKIIAIVALVVAVAGLSLGFAAFSKELTISDATATVKGDASKFNVHFATEVGGTGTGSVTGETSDTLDGFSAESGILADTTVSNLKATFANGKGSQTVTYNFYVYNGGELNAYLKKVTFSKPTPTCQPTASGNPAKSELVNAACADVKMKITIDDETYDATNDSITGQELAVSNGKAVKVELIYDDTHAVDGDFDVDFGSITLNYSSTDGE